MAEERSWDDWEVTELQENYEAEMLELRDRLSAAEQERAGWRARFEEPQSDDARFWKDTAAVVTLAAQAAEARAEAALQALESIVLRCEEGDASTDWRPTIVRIARAALAGREPQ